MIQIGYFDALKFIVTLIAIICYCAFRRKANSFQAKLLRKEDEKFNELQMQFLKAWGKHGSLIDGLFGTVRLATPRIMAIYNVHNDKFVKKHIEYCRQIGDVKCKGHGINPGNRQRNFHGTSSPACAFNGKCCKRAECKLCHIIEDGFQIKFAKTGYFGVGHYSSASSSTSVRYAKHKKIINGVVFVVGVACGIAEVLDGKTDLADNDKYKDKRGPTKGYHSRVVNNPQEAKAYKDHSAQHGQPLLKSINEIIVFDDAAMLPKYLIVFESTDNT